MDDKKFIVVQEGDVGYFRMLSTKGFAPKKGPYTLLAFDEETATILAHAFWCECGRKCWVEEVKQ